MQSQGMPKIEPHFFAAFSAGESACAMMDLLPACDLVESLKNLLYIQHDLFIHIIEGKHYGSNNLATFVDYTLEVKDEINRLKNAD
jgi:hypothetical protein